jgi:hypothetical protein
MIGRKHELALFGEKYSWYCGHGQIIGITAEAGMGKSRLVAEGYALPEKRPCWVWRACQSDGVNLRIWYGSRSGTPSLILIHCPPAQTNPFS